MSRDSNGNYTLPSGNPVITGTTITSTWANTTMEDIAAELTDSLDRSGKGGMLAPLKLIDGTKSAPALTFSSEPTLGWYRAGAGDMRATIGGSDVLTINSGGVSIPTLVPVGTVVEYAAAAAPTGWAICDGSAISRSVYAALFSVIGTLYGVGDGSTTFNLPDCRARTIVGYDSGAATGRVTAAGSGVDAGTLGAAGGHQQLQSHTHTAVDSGHTHTAADSGHTHANTINDPTHHHQVLHANGPLSGIYPGYIASPQGNNFTYDDTLTAAGGTEQNMTDVATGVTINNVAGNAVVTVNSGTANVANSSTGGGNGQNMPPTIVLQRIIKVN